jgi:hypothetical protein
LLWFVNFTWVYEGLAVEASGLLKSEIQGRLLTRLMQFWATTRTGRCGIRFVPRIASLEARDMPEKADNEGV